MEHSKLFGQVVFGLIIIGVIAWGVYLHFFKKDKEYYDRLADRTTTQIKVYPKKSYLYSPALIGLSALAMSLPTAIEQAIVTIIILAGVAMLLVGIVLAKAIMRASKDNSNEGSIQTIEEQADELTDEAIEEDAELLRKFAEEKAERDRDKSLDWQIVRKDYADDTVGYDVVVQFKTKSPYTFGMGIESYIWVPKSFAAMEAINPLVLDFDIETPTGRAYKNALYDTLEDAKAAVERYLKLRKPYTVEFTTIVDSNSHTKKGEIF